MSPRIVPSEHRDATSEHSSPRGGFTLVELMVAMVVFAMGILAMASTASVVVRQMGDAGRMSVAASVAQSRIEQLYAGNCKTASNGTATTRGVNETWFVTPATRSALILVSVTYVTRRGNRSQTYQSSVSCT
jgi:prepilin-type N-terminal cleavage/methylation domain-containing protein